MQSMFKQIFTDTNKVFDTLPFLEGSTLDIGSQDFTQEDLMKLVNVSSQDLATLEEETMQHPALDNGAMENAMEVDAHLYHLPDLERVDSGLFFDVTMKGDSNSWVFEPSLGKIFIKMNSAMTINVTYPLRQEDLFLRAMILFDNPSEMHLPVKRCANHVATAMCSSDSAERAMHVLKSLHPHANYQGTENGTIFKDRLSVVVPLKNGTRDDVGNYSLAISYAFACQNSCTSGINRKSTSIVFTLEDINYRILGKKVVQFKVCSCPKRDAERETKHDNNKRKAAGAEPFPKGKRPKYAPKNEMEMKQEIKTEPDDSDSPAEEEWVKAMICMPDNESLRHVLKCAFNEIAGKMAAGKTSPAYTQGLRAIRKALNNLDKESHYPD